MQQTQRGPGETITQAQDMAFDALLPHCKVLYHNNDNTIEMADKVKDLIEKGYFVQSPAEFIEIDGVDGVIENGQMEWVIISTEEGRVFCPFHQYANDPNTDFNDLVHPSELGLHPKQMTIF